MLIVALVLAVIGLAALVTAVVTSNEVIAWVCIGASVLGVLLLIIDAVRERSRRDAESAAAAEPDEAPEDEAAEGATPDDEADAAGADEAGAPQDFDADYPEDTAGDRGNDDATAPEFDRPSEADRAPETAATGPTVEDGPESRDDPDPENPDPEIPDAEIPDPDRGTR